MRNKAALLSYREPLRTLPASSLSRFHGLQKRLALPHSTRRSSPVATSAHLALNLPLHLLYFVVASNGLNSSPHSFRSCGPLGGRQAGTTTPSLTLRRKGR